MNQPNQTNTALNGICAIIRKDFKAITKEVNGIWHPALPYLEAMERIPSVHSDFNDANGSDIVESFLHWASGWRGPVARIVKKTLREELKGKR
jgi:hypothetical protein